MGEKESLKEAKEVSSPETTPPASTVYEDLEKTKLNIDSGAEREQVTQDDETISYPGGLKLFLLASAALFIFIVKLLIKVNTLLTAL